MTSSDLPADAPMMSWQFPIDIPEWNKDFPSMYVSLLGSQIRLVKGKRSTTRVIEAGSGEPLLLLHGLGASAEAYFRNIVPLSENFHVCAIDLLLHGFSSREATGTDDIQQAQVNHIIDFIDAMGFDKVNIEGESWGADLAFRMALDHPDRVSKIIFNTGSPVAWALSGEFSVPFRPPGGVLSGESIYGENSRALRYRLEWLMVTPDRVTEELYQMRKFYAAIPELVAAPRKSMKGWTRMGPPDQAAERAEKLENDLRRVSVPVLVVWSEFNSDSGQDRGRRLAELIPGAKFHLIRNAAHWPQYEQPEEHDRVVTDFLLGKM